MPNTPGTPRRSVRVPDDLWRDAVELAKERDQRLSDVIRDALELYVKWGAK